MNIISSALHPKRMSAGDSRSLCRSETSTFDEVPSVISAHIGDQAFKARNGSCQGASVRSRGEIEARPHRAALERPW